MLTRRQFIGTTAGAALAEKLFAAPKESKTPNPELEKLADHALREAKKLKDRTVFMDFRTDPTENVFPMVQAGKGINEMLLGSEDL